MRVLAALSLASCHDDDPPPDDPRDEAQAHLVEGGEILCPDPALRDGAPFDDKQADQQAVTEMNLFGGGLLVEDLDQDGWLDLFLPSQTSLQLFYGRSGVLTDLFDEDTTSLAFPSLSFAVGATAADVDGDGDPDVLVTRWERPHTLLRNEGNRVFVDVTEEAFGGLPPDLRAQTASWGDVDGDGDLDLFVGSYGLFADLDVLDPSPDCSDHLPDPKLLWLNDGTGHFTDASALLPPEIQVGYTFASGFFDLHDDGFPELFVANDDGLCGQSLWLDNDGGVFTANTTNGFHPNSHDMGMGVAALNDDELPDFLLTSWNGASLLESNVGDDGTVRYVEYGSNVGLVPAAAPQDSPGQAEPGDQVYGWGAEFGDVDNDADLDAAMVFGFWQNFDGDGDPLTQRDGLWIQDEQGQFTDEAAAWGVAELGISRSVVLADIDNDGWLDILKRVLDTPSPLHISRCGEAAWARIRLEAPPPNTAGVGARVRVTAGGKVHTRWITAGSTGMYSGSPLEAHVGLGTAEIIDRIDVIWPDGEISTFEGVIPRQQLTIVRDR